MKKEDVNKCDPNSGCCTPTNEIPRRDFLRLSALGAAAFSLPLSAGNIISITKEGHIIPADKNLSPEWIKSLTARGIPDIYTSAKDNLKYIGMPIGGICSGQLYISGDGRLWLWDIFQSDYENPDTADETGYYRMDYFSMGGLYANPRTSEVKNNLTQVKNGFSIRYGKGEKAKTVSLDSSGFKDVTFRGEYPIAKVNYKDATIPLEVGLTAYSPFLPLNVKDSAIPATVLTYEIKNTSSKKLTVDIGGWLENKVSPNVNDIAGTRTNNVISENGKTTILLSAKGDGLEERKGFGDMSISLLDDDVNANVSVSEVPLQEAIFNKEEKNSATVKLSESLIGGVSKCIKIKPGETKKVTFLVSWYFPDYKEQVDGSMVNIIDFKDARRYYSSNFLNSNDVATYVTTHFDRLSKTTLKWNATWYDSTLPYYLLDRSFISMDCLASQTSHMFDDGRFWGWEGVQCCPGTCTHVWQYAQGMARIFPAIESDMRSRVDYGISYNENGALNYRGENLKSVATDGQLGTIIRVYREHTMSKDTVFLNNLWPRVKQSMQYVIDEDKDKDGLLEGKQFNTLDVAWEGPMGWISGLFLSALKACEQMALEIGDTTFAQTCSSILSKGQKSYVEKLFNNEYFIHRPPNYNATNTNKGCHIDQVLGQSFAYQVNLPNALPQKETRSALNSIWKYNFAPDAGQYAIDHKTIKGQRTYAMPGEAGLVMTTWPTGGDEKAVPGMAGRKDDGIHFYGPGGYFDEVMNGFEYQVASHMVWEGMLTEGLTIMKTVHERYSGDKRNPYDEIECSSHYSRSMASYGVYLAACGFSYHGPKGELGFAPKINPEDFKCAFTVAEGWGAFTQKYTSTSLTNSIDIQYGQLKLNQYNIELPANFSVNTVEATISGVKTPLDFKLNGNQLSLNFEKELLIKENEKLKIKLS